MGEHTYCCCAIPLLNVGIYLTIMEQFTVAVLAGILAIATPQMVGSSLPSVAPWLFAAGCFVGCLVQGMGFIGVFKEKAGLFQRYVQVNTAVISYIFAIAATWIIISATRHDTATTDCVNSFFPANATSTASTGTGEGQTICNIFTWVDVGLQGGLWLIMVIFQGYLILITKWYGNSQLADHTKYYSIYSVTAPEGVALGERRQPDAWDPRPSTDSWSGGGLNNPRGQYMDHGRQNSDGAYGVGAQDVREKGYGGYRDEAPQPYRTGSQMSQAYVSHPDQAYTSQTEPTPVAMTSPEQRYLAGDPYGDSPSSVTAPPGAIPPNEGQFGRKTPRQQDQYDSSYNTQPTYTSGSTYTSYGTPYNQQQGQPPAYPPQYR